MTTLRPCNDAVMPGFMPGIRGFDGRRFKDVDGGDKPGHNANEEAR
jgi:hypothetical protein